MSSCSVPGQVRRVFKDAGRVCPVDYRLAPDAFAGEPRGCVRRAVRGGRPVRQPVRARCGGRAGGGRAGRRARRAERRHALVRQDGRELRRARARAARYTPLVGNVEAELRRQVDVGVGCGCAYPDCTGDDAVSRSNRIHKKLSEAVDAHPELKELLAVALPRARWAWRARRWPSRTATSS
ncbi:MAG: hypothetical protein V8S24_02005 [Gordonibacter pamelaeae]